MVTDQNITIEGNRLDYNGHSLWIKPPFEAVNVLRIKENDKIINAVADNLDIFIEMKSGDKFVLRDYWHPEVSQLVRRDF